MTLTVDADKTQFIIDERSALKGERHGFAVPVLCMTEAPLYT